MISNFTIAAVSDEVGIAKEVLRKWELRYGFPMPKRDTNDIRLYSGEQIKRLKLIKRLIDDGMRPNQVVALEEQALIGLIENRQRQITVVSDSGFAHEVVQWLQSRDPELLRNNLCDELVRLGMRKFVLVAMPMMNQAVGDAWSDGRVSIGAEHLYTESVQALIRTGLSQTSPVSGSPRILLTTLTGELHTLGLLMVETMLTLEGATCISLGAQTPLPEIATAAQAYQADIVGLSFSAAFPKKKILPLLRELRTLCAPQVQLWAGGSGIVGLDQTPRGVLLLQTSPDAIKALQKYRRHANVLGKSV